jgi:pimeloyl-ACP methyl ester carboxylesterase
MRPDRAGLVDVGDGREIYLECHGTGSPTVVLVSGLNDSAQAWDSLPESAQSPSNVSTSSAASPASGAAGTVTVYEGVSRFTRVCAYDRPGTSDGRSTPVPQPTSAQTSADDLEKLLAAAGEAEPYVVVGHSYGGPIARLFVSDHPDQIAGLVLVDGLSEDIDAGLTPQQQNLLLELNAKPAPEAETFDLQTVFTQLRQAPAPPDVPVIVLTADAPQLTPEMLASGQLPAGVDKQFADAVWAAQTAAQSMLTAKFAHAKQVTNTHSDHYIQVNNPQLVIDSIREIVDDAARSEPSR